jgi:hypothetical protein
MPERGHPVGRREAPPRRLSHDRVQLPQQFRKIDRLADVGVGGDGARLRAQIRRHRQQRNAGQHRVGALLDAELPSVHHRHHQVEEDHVGRGAAVKGVERLAAVGRGRHRESLVLQHVRQRQPDADVVLDEQHADSRWRRGFLRRAGELRGRLQVGHGWQT